jgi:hypothetical protein
MKMHRKLRCVLDVLYHLHGFTEFQSCISRIFFLCYPLTGDQVYKLFMFFFLPYSERNSRPAAAVKHPL